MCGRGSLALLDGPDIGDQGQAFLDEAIVSALMRQLSWTHFLSLIYVPHPMQRNFYAEMCRVEGCSTRTLRKKIDSMLYERTALSKQPEKFAGA